MMRICIIYAVTASPPPLVNGDGLGMLLNAAASVASLNEAPRPFPAMPWSIQTREREIERDKIQDGGGVCWKQPGLPDRARQDPSRPLTEVTWRTAAGWVLINTHDEEVSL